MCAVEKMKTQDRQKICSHCDGRIAIEASTCLYCGMPLLSEKAPEIKNRDTLSEQQSVDSLYPPPYSSKATSQLHGDKEFTGTFKTPIKPKPLTQESSLNVNTSNETQEPSGFIPILLTLLGSNLFILGLMQALFSDHGVLRLEWKSGYWFVFCLASLPMLYFGMRKNKNPQGTTN